jgi:hypothetical protein
MNDWTLSRKKMPDFDGMYYVYGFMHHPCGNVTPFYKVVECKMNQWVKSDIGEQMTYWRSNLPPPIMEDEEGPIESALSKAKSLNVKEGDKVKEESQDSLICELFQLSYDVLERGHGSTNDIKRAFHISRVKE